MFYVRDNQTRRVLAVFGTHGAAMAFARREMYRGHICSVTREG